MAGFTVGADFESRPGRKKCSVVPVGTFPQSYAVNPALKGWAISTQQPWAGGLYPFRIPVPPPTRQFDLFLDKKTLLTPGLALFIQVIDLIPHVIELLASVIDPTPHVIDPMLSVMVPMVEVIDPWVQVKVPMAQVIEPMAPAGVPRVQTKVPWLRALKPPVDGARPGVNAVTFCCPPRPPKKNLFTVWRKVVLTCPKTTASARPKMKAAAGVSECIRLKIKRRF